MNLPWENLFTIERSGLPEVTVSGIVSVVDLAHSKSTDQYAVGQTDALLWSRSLLKPWQLLSHYPDLKADYPELLSHHFAVMLSSHNGEEEQLQYVQEILAQGGLSASDLMCPACFPMSDDRRHQLQTEGKQVSALYNPCSGKHSGYLLDLKAKKQPLSNYLDANGKHFLPLKELMAWMLGKPATDFPHTTDGCLLPNYPMTATQLAASYGLLASGLNSNDIDDAPSELKSMLNCWSEIASLMTSHPKLVGGHKRLDSKLMMGDLTDNKTLNIVAKEGAQGMLAVGISNLDRYPKGLGILVKISTGWDPHYLEIVISLVFEQLGLKTPAVAETNPHLKTICHFQLPVHQKA